MKKIVIPNTNIAYFDEQGKPHVMRKGESYEAIVNKEYVLCCGQPLPKSFFEIKENISEPRFIDDGHYIEDTKTGIGYSKQLNGMRFFTE
jgi:hypothetical protein